jgi:hypothetical protein
MTPRKHRFTPAEIEQSAGFCIGPDGELEMMTEAEVHDLLTQTIREALVEAFASDRRERTVH